MPWFQGFAGTAFTWQAADGAVTFTAVQPSEPHRVFSVVPEAYAPAEPEHDDGIVLFSR